MTPAFTAAQLLDAVQRHHHAAALVREVELSSTTGEPSRRIDGLLFRTLIRTAIEAKVTRADYRRDVAAKREPWQRVTHRFVYLTPAGLLAPHEIPPGCGLWEVSRVGSFEVVEVRVRARVNRSPQPLPEQTVQALAYRAMRPTS